MRQSSHEGHEGIPQHDSSLVKLQFGTEPVVIDDFSLKQGLEV